MIRVRSPPHPAAVPKKGMPIVEIDQQQRAAGGINLLVLWKGGQARAGIGPDDDVNLVRAFGINEVM